MLSIFDTCVPREEVLRGELHEDIFAARLKDVLEGTADPVYGDAKKYFDNTFPTAGLKTLIADTIDRLVGDGVGKNAILRLETSFGGGKTHNLIALYHAARGEMPPTIAKEMLGDEVRLPRPSEVNIAGVVGFDFDPSVGIQHPQDHLSTFTLWGELAYQLGGRTGYALVKDSEDTKAAVGTGLLETLIGDQPTLILVDEIARHLRVAAAIPTKSGKSNLAEQTVAFLMSLLEFSASKKHCVVVLTLASEHDAFGAETAILKKALSEIQAIAARSERVLTPTAETEIPAIVTHRLFKTVDRSKATPVFQAYSYRYQQLLSQNAELPQRSRTADYQDQIRSSYPFHPELLNTLNRRVATIPNFNQTRGALRLLAWTVRNLWDNRPVDTWLIHPYHIDLSISQIAEDLTARLDRPAFRQVIQSDITSSVAGSPAHAQILDGQSHASGSSSYAGRAATVIFLNSLAQGVAEGIEPAEVLLSVLTPDGSGGGDEPTAVIHNLERLYNNAWYLEYDGRRYRFKTEPSINKIIADEAQMLSVAKAKTEIDNRIHGIWKRGFLQPVYFPASPVDLDDDSNLPKLAIIHYDAAHTTDGSHSPPDLVRRLYDRTGAAEGFRKYQNNVVFLAADAEGIDKMVQVAKRYLGVGRITGDGDRMAAFNEEQRKKLRAALDTAELELRIAITRVYRFLYYPSPDAPQVNSRLARATLPAQDQGEVNKDQSNVLIRVLHQLKRVLTADDEELSALFVKTKAWDENQTSLTTAELRRAFARKISLPVLLEPGQLRRTIQNGVRSGQWVYYDAQEDFAYGKNSPPAAWSITEDTHLYLPEEAKRLSLRVKGEWQPPERGGGAPTETCPVCHNPIAQCHCGQVGPGGGVPTVLRGSGAVSQAFQQILDAAQEHNIDHLARLVIQVSGTGRSIAGDVHAFGLAIPQFGQPDVSLTLNLSATYGQNAEAFTTTFRGGWERYKRLKNISDAFALEAGELHESLEVTIRFAGGCLPVEDPMFSTFRDVLTTLPVGKIELHAYPAQEEAA